MPRVRVIEDYEARKREILDAAARLFARDSYANTKMEEIAARCGASKSMLYHYFPKKEDLLFEMLKDHLERMVEMVDSVRSPELSPEESFRRFIREYVFKSAKARTRHVVAMYDVRFLLDEQRERIVQIERELLAKVADLVRGLNPNLSEVAYRPYAMFLFGLLNWTDIWYRPTGPLSPDELAERISDLFLKGFLSAR